MREFLKSIFGSKTVTAFTFTFDKKIRNGLQLDVYKHYEDGSVKKISSKLNIFVGDSLTVSGSNNKKAEDQFEEYLRG